MTTLENPPAFPMGNPEQGGYDGMTLRDYLAGQALIALPRLTNGMHWSPEEAACDAYLIATAMLRERGNHRSVQEHDRSRLATQMDFIDYHLAQANTYTIQRQPLSPDNISSLNYHIQKLHEGGKTAIDKMDQLVSKLIGYSRHDDDCAIVWLPSAPARDCTCGYSDTIAEARKFLGAAK